jgi:hypothetical protein
MLTLTANDQPLGSTISVNSTNPQPIQIQLHTRSIDPIQSIRIIHNGRILREHNLPADQRPSPELPLDRTFTGAFTGVYTPTRSGWYAAQAVYQLPTGELRQAHTSPIYVTVDDKPTAFAADARYMLRWIDAIEQVAQQPDRYPTPEARQATLDAYAEARVVYERVIQTAQTHWGDD